METIARLIGSRRYHQAMLTINLAAVAVAVFLTVTR